MENSFGSTSVPDLDTDTSLYPPIPAYVEDNYWWAYVHPHAVYFWDRQWLINLVLLGNYKRLCAAVLDGCRRSLPGRTLQVGCAYGNITPRLAQCVEQNGMLDVIDVLQVQLDNLAPKLPQDARVKLHCMDSTALNFDDACFDRVVFFLLLHEQPVTVRKQTLAEALRVLRPGGTITIVDYARPNRFNLPCRLWTSVLEKLKPFASDLWNGEVADWLPTDAGVVCVRRLRFFGGFFQILTFTSDSVTEKR
ncbi:MAG: hypothetical protein A3I66_19390 [Burkholderiales bacterium RIFCSPLOWO2_02_FULL_57_36]|nr:MAG: hypothetical protein A3I66_19390 [Burkholderiales bacterium RIFCSPLOWO2_02_FULL_57_36]